MASTHQCFERDVEHETYNRQAPSSVGTRAGRSSDAAPNCSLVTVATVVNETPSSDRAITLAYPRPAVTGRRSRYAR
jgi:hypothetical protein